MCEEQKILEEPLTAAAITETTGEGETEKDLPADIAKEERCQALGNKFNLIKGRFPCYLK